MSPQQLHYKSDLEDDEDGIEIDDSDLDPLLDLDKVVDDLSRKNDIKTWLGHDEGQGLSFIGILGKVFVVGQWIYSIAFQ